MDRLLGDESTRTTLLSGVLRPRADPFRQGTKGSVSSRANVRIFEVGPMGNHAFCMMLSAMRVALAKRERRREAETVWL